MRIEAYTQVQQLYQATRPQKAQRAEKGGSKDQIQISSAGKDYQTIRKALKSVPDVREDLVSSIKSRIDAGTYEADIDSFAAKLYSKYQETR